MDTESHLGADAWKNHLKGFDWSSKSSCIQQPVYLGVYYLQTHTYWCMGAFDIRSASVYLWNSSFVAWGNCIWLDHLFAGKVRRTRAATTMASWWRWRPMKRKHLEEVPGIAGRPAPSWWPLMPHISCVHSNAYRHTWGRSDRLSWPYVIQKHRNKAIPLKRLMGNGPGISLQWVVKTLKRGFPTYIFPSTTDYGYAGRPSNELVMSASFSSCCNYNCVECSPNRTSCGWHVDCLHSCAWLVIPILFTTDVEVFVLIDT